jgi:peptidoglycan endopeptidase LytE
VIVAVAGCVALAAPTARAHPQAVSIELYRVSSGDTLWSLARRFGTTPDRLASANGISPDGILSIGQQLRIPVPSGPQAAVSRNETGPTPARSTGPVGTYRVQAGDTLWSVSRRFGTVPDRLAAMNGISIGGILKIGRELSVPLSHGIATGTSPRGGPRPSTLPADAQAPRDAAMRDRLARLPSRGARWTSDFVALSIRQLGVRYRWGGTTPSGFDCSGFLYYVFGRMGVMLPRTTFAMYEAGAPVPREALETGDIVFFQTISPGPSHAGIYLGDGRFIHSSSGTGHVTITPLDDGYYASRYLGARRF